MLLKIVWFGPWPGANWYLHFYIGQNGGNRQVFYLVINDCLKLFSILSNAVILWPAKGKTKTPSSKLEVNEEERQAGWGPSN